MIHIQQPEVFANGRERERERQTCRETERDRQTNRERQPMMRTMSLLAGRVDNAQGRKLHRG